MFSNKVSNFLKNFENLALLFLNFLIFVLSFFVALFITEKIHLFSVNFIKIANLSYGFLFFLLLAIIFYILRNPINLAEVFLKFLFVLLPSVIVLLIGFFQIPFTKTFIGFQWLKIFLTAYAMCWFFWLFIKSEKSYLICLGKKFNFNDAVLKIKNKKNAGVIIMIILIMILNFSFGLYHLGERAAVDEPLWTDFDGRIVKFWNNVSDGEFYKTMVSDKPGITVAILSGIGLIKIDPMKYKNIKGQESDVEYQKKIKNFNFAFRFPILLFNVLMFPIYFLFIRRLFGKSIGIIATSLISLSPILVGISVIVNPDALIWVFVPLSILGYLIYLKEENRSFLYLSGIFLGLAILTKYVANILYIFFLLLIFIELLLNYEKYTLQGINKYLRTKIFDWIILTLISIAVFIIFLPAAWVDLRRVFEGTIFSKAFLPIWPFFIGISSIILIDAWLFKNRIVARIYKKLASWKNIFIPAVSLIFIFFIILMVANTYMNMIWYDLESILASPKSAHSFNNFMGMMSANFYSSIFGIIPIAVFGVLVVLFKSIFVKNKSNIRDIYVIYLILFILVYYIASIISGVSATVRYQILIYPIILIIGAIGIYDFFSLVKKIPSEKWILQLFIVVFCLISLNSIKPFYFSYASDLLPKKYVLNLKDMGDGSYEAAQYLNSLPDAKSLIVWTDKKGVCSFFVGYCNSGIGFNNGTVEFDYFVVSSGRESRTTKMTLSKFNGGNSSIIRLDKLYAMEDADFYLKIGGRSNNFVKVISAKNINQDN